MDKSAPTYTTPGTYIDIENRIIDKYLPHIGVYGFAVYVAIKRQGIFAPKNARNMPPFSRQRFVANLCPTANLSGNTLLPYDTTHKAKNSFNTLYNNDLDGENLSSDLRQTFVASAANLPDKAHRYRAMAWANLVSPMRSALRPHQGVSSACSAVQPLSSRHRSRA
jgi:hypothetical protein